MVADLTKPLTQRLRHSVDLLLFNPPYVPTDDEEASGAQSGADIEGSWAGGKDGMRITDILLDQLDASSQDTLHLCILTDILGLIIA